jgi:hypothetical protein
MYCRMSRTSAMVSSCKYEKYYRVVTGGATARKIPASIAAGIRPEQE